MKKRFLSILLVLTIAFTVAPLFSTIFAASPEPCNPGNQAGTPVNLSDCLKLSNDDTVAERYSDSAVLINLLVSNLFIIAGIFLFGLTIYAGFQMVTGGKKGFDEARQVITTAITGFMIMFAAYWIIQIVKYLTGTPIPI